MILGKLFVCVLVTCLVDIIAAACPNGATAQGDYCFIASKSTSNFAKAFMFCQAYGCGLAIPDSTAKQAALTTFLNANSMTAGQVFFGVIDTLEEDTWIKVPTGEEWSDFTFDSGEPNGGTNDNCLTAKSFSTWKMGDISCGSNYKFVCECDSI